MSAVAAAPIASRAAQASRLLVGGVVNGGTKFSVGGHRGCGENLMSRGSQSVRTIEPAYRENTVRSFVQAANLGVSFVEFDAQVTKDGCPVIWHDDKVIIQRSHDAASPVTEEFEVKDLTLEEFRGLVSFKGVAGSQEESWATPVMRQFRSKGPSEDQPQGNSPWVCRLDDQLPTLMDLFQSLPEEVGFDIEVKMAVPDDVEVTPREEVLRVVQPILECVNACTAGSNRSIMFSSFDPDVCIEVARQQSKYPVMYLSGCGLYKHVDARRTSIPAAINFASQNNLAGIVLPASILMANMGLVQDAAARNLAVLTYGLENDDVECIRQQQQLGVQAAIVDDVQAVMGALFGSGGEGVEEKRVMRRVVDELVTPLAAVGR